MDAAAHYNPPFTNGGQRSRNERADRSKDQGGVERFGRQHIRVIGPGYAQAPGEVLRAAVAGAGEGIHFLALMQRYLGDNMGRRAEAVDPQPTDPLSGHAVGAVANQPGAQQWSRSSGIVIG